MTDLGDFFAKKDKKKSKGEKFTTANEIDKKLLESDKRRERFQRESRDDEWKAFEEKKKDYTGLKIQNTTLNEQDETVEHEIEVDGKPTTYTPWKVQIKEDSPTDEVKWQERETLRPCSVAKDIKATYIPPHLRNKPTIYANTRPQKDNNGTVLKSFFVPPSADSPSVWAEKR